LWWRSRVSHAGTHQFFSRLTCTPSAGQYCSHVETGSSSISHCGRSCLSTSRHALLPAPIHPADVGPVNNSSFRGTLLLVLPSTEKRAIAMTALCFSAAAAAAADRLLPPLAKVLLQSSERPTSSMHLAGASTKVGKTSPFLSVVLIETFQLSYDRRGWPSTVTCICPCSARGSAGRRATWRR
jgi:hypothetical protein